MDDSVYSAPRSDICLRRPFRATAVDKIIALVTLMHSVLGVVWNAEVVSSLGFVSAFHAVIFFLAALGIFCGIALLRHRHWALYWMLPFYLVQLIHVLTYSFDWSANLGFNFQFSFGWAERGWLGDCALGVDLFAAPMLCLATFRALAIYNSFMPKPLRGSA